MSVPVEIHTYKREYERLNYKAALFWNLLSQNKNRKKRQSIY